MSCLATDYDGTLAHQGVVDEATTHVLIAFRRRQPNVFPLPLGASAGHTVGFVAR
jgi:hypothetical protein